MSVDPDSFSSSEVAPTSFLPEQMLRGLREVAALARGAVAGRELREQIIDRAQETFGGDAIALWRFESRDRAWRIAAARGLSADYSAVDIPAVGESRTAVALDGPLFVPDVRAWPVAAERR